MDRGSQASEEAPSPGRASPGLMSRQAGHSAAYGLLGGGATLHPSF